MKAAGLLLAAALLAGESIAQVPAPYASDKERLVESLVFPAGRRDFVRKATQYCGARYDELRVPSLVAYAHWVRRHAALLRMTESLRLYLTQQATQDPQGKGAGWKRLLGEDIPRQIERLSSSSMQTITGQTSEEARRATCTATIASVAQLKLDLDQTDAELARYLRGVAAKNAIELPAAQTDPTVGPPGARRDLAALQGRWQTQKVVYYFADGTERQADGTCSLAITSDQVESDCQGLKGPYKVRYALKADDSGHYASEILDHSGNQGAVGSRADGVFRVEGSTLHISVFPLPHGGEEKAPVEIESVAVLREADKR